MNANDCLYSLCEYDKASELLHHSTVATALGLASSHAALERNLRENEEEIDELKEQVKDLEYTLNNYRRLIEDAAERFLILDPRLDPDPYGMHGLPLQDRLHAMKRFEPL